MSKKLINSLFQNKSQARSSSLFCSTLISNTGQKLKQRSRSQSHFIAKSMDQPRLLPLCRAVHLLAIKVKKLSYFLFCRLEANYKKSLKQLQSYKQTDTNNINEYHQNTSLINRQGINNNNYNDKVHNLQKIKTQRQIISNGLDKFEDSFNIIFSKYFKQKHLKDSFDKIKIKNIKLKAAHKIILTTQNFKKQSIMKIISYLEYLSRENLKIQILVGILKNTFNKHQTLAFLSILSVNQYQDKHYPWNLASLKQITQQSLQSQQTITHGQDHIVFLADRKEDHQSDLKLNEQKISFIRIQEQKKYKLQKQCYQTLNQSSSQKLKNKIKQHYPKIERIKMKSNKLFLNFDKQIIIKKGWPIDEWKHQTMIKIINLHAQQALTYTLPDLNDHLNVFQQIQGIEQINFLSQQFHELPKHFQKQIIGFSSIDMKQIEKCSFNQHSSKLNLKNPSKCSSPLKKIEKMLMDLQKIRQKEPKQKLFQLQNSFNNDHTIKMTPFESKTSPKFDYSAKKTCQLKNNVKQIKQKQNMNEKIWKMKQIRDKYLFYPNNNNHLNRERTRNCSSNLRSPEKNNQKEKYANLTTARKMQKQIDKLIVKKSKNLSQNFKILESGKKVHYNS